MTIIAETFPMCDVCQESYADYRGDRLRAGELRRDMKWNGWQRRKRGVVMIDICPECVRKDGE